MELRIGSNLIIFDEMLFSINIYVIEFCDVEGWFFKDLFLFWLGEVWN